METGSSDKLVKPRIEPASPGLQSEWFIHNTKVAPNKVFDYMGQPMRK